MDITNENFVRSLPEITETIAECDFVAIDTELSGLMRERSLNKFDLPEERFSKAVASSRGYFIMQFGLSCFKATGDLKYSNRTYNFYIFPQPNNIYGDMNRTFALQAHAIQFLTEHNFDFNKLFRQGVSYLTFQEKKLLMAQLKADTKARSKVEFDSAGVPTFVPATMSVYCQACMQKVQKFIEERKAATEFSNDPISSSSSQDTSYQQDSEMPDQDADNPNRLELRDCNSNHRRAIMKRVLECCSFADNMLINYARDTETNENYLVIEYMDKKAKSAKQKNDLAMAKGFLEVIEWIIVHKKPLVGHNLSLDLIQIINQFMEPLSDNYFSFKETCNSLFPVIYDTKYIAHQILDPKTLTNNQSRLNDLYCQLRDSNSFPKIDVELLGHVDNDKQLPHQAGYDAYMSGYSFISLCEAYLRQIKSKKSKQSKVEDCEQVPGLTCNRKILDEFANRIHLSFSYDFKYFYLSGEDLEPNRKHVFYLEFPSTWALDDIFQLFHQYGGVEACKLSSTSALCALRDPKQVKEVLKKVKNQSDASYCIHTYEKYLECFKMKKKDPVEGDDVSFSFA